MKKGLFTLVATLCIVSLWLFQYKITVNIPWWDDFHGIILPVYHLFTEGSWYSKFLELVSLNNEHRVVNDRVFTLLVYIITGQFQLKLVAMLGFINLIGIFAVTATVLRKKTQNYWTLLPLVFLIFQAQYYESLQSLMVPFQNFSVIMYMLLALYFIIYRNNIWGAGAFAVFSLFSHGNGILSFILVFLVILLQQKPKRAFFWATFSGLIIFLYFLGYHKPAWIDENVISPRSQPFTAFTYIFEFLGAYALNIIQLSTSLTTSSWMKIIPTTFGFILVAGLALIILKIYPLKSIKTSLFRLGKNKENQFFLSMAAFFIATGIMMGLTRAGFPVLSRYTINGTFLLIAIWGFYVVNYTEKYSKVISVLSFIILLFTYYNNFDKALFTKNNLITDAINFQNTGSWANSYSDSSHVSRVNPLLVMPLKAEKYVFPKSQLDDYKHWEIQAAKEIPDTQIVGNYLIFSGKIHEGCTPYFSAESEKYAFIFPVGQVKNNIFKFLTTGNYYSSYYQTAFPINVIPMENYHLYQMYSCNGKQKKFDLKKTLFGKQLL